MRDNGLVIVRYRKGLKLGIVKESSSGKLKIQIDKSRDVSVPQENLLFDLEESATSHTELDAALKDIHQRANALDLEEVWELVVDEEEAFGFREIADLASMESPREVATLLWHLNGDDCLHFHAEGESYRPADREAIAARLAKIAKAEQEKAEDQALLDWLSSDSELTPADFTMRQTQNFERIREFVLEGDESGQAGRVKSFTAKLPSVGGDPQRALFDLLVRRGIFREDEHLALLRLDIPISFDEADEAPFEPANTSDSRRDLRELHVLSIDDATTSDVDDALSLETLDDGFRLGVHITDLSGYVPNDSSLDRCARHRINSLYFPEQKIPMLPHWLSEGAGSLAAGEERQAVSLFVEFDTDCEMRQVEFAQTLIKNDRRWTYDAVDETLAGSDTDEETESLRVLDRFTARLQEKRVEAGAPLLSRSDLEIRVSEDGTISVELRATDSLAQRIVSELMILYNVEAARFCRDREVSIVYRTQSGVKAGDFPEGTHPVIARNLTLKSAAPPDLTLEPGSHGMLGVELYTQASSPLRRYMDLLHQRQLVAAIDKPDGALTKDEVSRILYETEERIRELRRLEPDRKRHWLARYLKDQIGDNFDAIVLDSGDRVSQVEVLALGMRSTAVLHDQHQAGDLIELRLKYVDPWDGTIRFGPA